MSFGIGIVMRNTGKEKIKRNKGFPYKQRRKFFCPHVNDRGTYVVVDEKNIVVERFRLKLCALQSLKRLESQEDKTLKVIKSKYL